ncbi:MAG TPA: hypothetical protein VND98_05590 [Solirubrobacterales bacterium]|nr:hypothetical protein [Solirubrobacterales bacterium]
MGTERNYFTAEEADRVRFLLSQIRRSERKEQESLRAQLRRLGFRISDWSGGRTNGFTVSDFDDLIEGGQISIGCDRVSGRRASCEVGDFSAIAKAAAIALGGPKFTLVEAASHVDDKPGLYALHGEAAAWSELRLGDPPDERPLYVGKAEASLVSRDLQTHFADGRTGSSTLRRSLAALLRDSLELRGQPRNLQNPGRLANFGMSPSDDAKLTTWMQRYLKLAVWPQEGSAELLAIERELLGQWRPPLNLKDVQTPWSRMLRSKRKLMATEAAEMPSLASLGSW